MVVIVHNLEIRVYFVSISNTAISFWHHSKNIFHLLFLISPGMEPSQNLFFSIIEKQISKLLNYSVVHGKKFPIYLSFLCKLYCIIRTMHY